MDYITKEQYEQLKYQIEHNPKRNKKKDRKMTLTLEECNQICHKYLNNDMKKLKEVTRKVITKYKKDSDENTKYELKDLSYMVFVLSLGTFDSEKSSFTTFLYGNMRRKFSTYGRDSTRGNRCAMEVERDPFTKEIKYDEKGNPVYIPVFNISLHSTNDDGNELIETISGLHNVEEEAISNVEMENEDNSRKYSAEMNKYLSGLSKVQMDVLDLITQGYEKDEIVDILHISKSLYNDSITAIRNPKTIRELRRKNYVR